MPNWCENILTLTFDSSRRAKVFENILNENDYFFESFVPPGDYGTKWDVHMDEVDFEIGENNIIYLNFNTAWTPCTSFCKSLTKLVKIELLELEYYEKGEDFSGKLIIRDSIIESEKFYDTYLNGVYIMNNDFFWDIIDEEIDDDDIDKYIDLPFVSVADNQKIKDLKK